MSGCAMMRTISPFSFEMIGWGVPADAETPHQLVNSYPGKPDSAAVGTSGSTAARFFPVVASARVLPDLTLGRAAGMVSALNRHCSPPTSNFPGPAPFLCTGTTLVFALL